MISEFCSITLHTAIPENYKKSVQSFVMSCAVDTHLLKFKNKDTI